MALQVLPGRLDLESYAGDDFAVLIEFAESDGTAYPVTASGFSAAIKRAAGDVTITVAQEGASSLRLSIADTDLGTSLSQDRWELRETATDRTWLAGDFVVSLSKASGPSRPANPTITVGTSRVTTTVSIGGGEGTFQALDADLTLIAAANNGAVLAATTASFTTADETKLDALPADALSTATAPELIRDTMGTALVAGSNVTITPNDGADTITIAAAVDDAIPFKIARYGSGDRTVTATTATDIPGVPDITIAAVVGDILRVSLNASAFHSTADSAVRMDAVTRVSGAGVNRISGVAEGVATWRSQGTAFSVARGAPFPYEVVSGDIDAGSVTLRLQAWTNAGTATIQADGTNHKIVWSVENLGPVTP